MNTLIGSGAVFCVLAAVGLLILFFILIFFLPSPTRGPRSPFIHNGRFFNRPPGGLSAGAKGTHSTGSSHGSVGHRSPSRGGGIKGGGIKGGKR